MLGIFHGTVKDNLSLNDKNNVLKYPQQLRACCYIVNVR